MGNDGGHPWIHKNYYTNDILFSDEHIIKKFHSIKNSNGRSNGYMNDTTGKFTLLKDTKPSEFLKMLKENSQYFYVVNNYYFIINLDYTDKEISDRIIIKDVSSLLSEARQKLREFNINQILCI